MPTSVFTFSSLHFCISELGLVHYEVLLSQYTTAVEIPPRFLVLYSVTLQQFQSHPLFDVVYYACAVFFPERLR